MQDVAKKIVSYELGKNYCWIFTKVFDKKYISSIVIVSVKTDSITSLKVKVTVYFTQITTVNKNNHFDVKTE